MPMPMLVSMSVPVDRLAQVVAAVEELIVQVEIAEFEATPHQS